MGNSIFPVLTDQACMMKFQIMKRSLTCACATALRTDASTVRCCRLQKVFFYKSSSPGEFHPQALTESDMNLSIHPAPVSHFLETSQFQADEEGN